MGQSAVLTDRRLGIGVVGTLTVVVATLHGTALPNGQGIASRMGGVVSIGLIGLFGMATWWTWTADLEGPKIKSIAETSLAGFLLGLVVASTAMGYQSLAAPTDDLWTVGHQAYVITVLGSLGGLVGWAGGRKYVKREAQFEQALDDRAELEQQAERMEHLASILAHDTTNPLNVASGRLDMAEESGDPAHFEAVRRAHDRIESIIQGSVQLAREGRTRDDLQPVGLEGAAKDVWHLVSTGDVELDVAEDASVLADPNSLRHVFENLFENAIRHGGEDLTTITVGRTLEGFYVADDGTGLPSGYDKPVFTAGMSTAPEGTGLGLAIVATIAESHGWDISARTGENGGARFDFDGVSFTTKETGVRGRSPSFDH